MRNTVADSYKDWSFTLAKLGADNPDEFARIQRCMNYAVFGKHRDNIRNTATADELKKMRKLEEQIIQMVEFGYIKTLTDVRDFLRKVWEKDYPTPFLSVN